MYILIRIKLKTQMLLQIVALDVGEHLQLHFTVQPAISRHSEAEGLGGGVNSARH